MKIIRIANRPPVRTGFTLIELLIVIAIISILMGLIMMAVQQARSAVSAAGVVTEMNQMDIAIGQFQAKYKMKYVPSNVTIHATAAGWNADARSRMIIKKIWPGFDFSRARTLPGNAASVVLTGDECLVLFLGGVSAGGSLNGFSTDPKDPFKTTGGRIGPFYEFDGGYDLTSSKWNGRLIDPDGDGFPAYADPMTKAHAYYYFSSYDGKGYRSAEQTAANFVAYRRTKDGKSAYNPKGYQLIAAGGDGAIGVGGYFNADTEEVGRVDGMGVLTNSEADRDNIANFAEGALIP